MDPVTDGNGAGAGEDGEPDDAPDDDPEFEPVDEEPLPDPDPEPDVDANVSAGKLTGPAEVSDDGATGSLSQPARGIAQRTSARPTTVILIMEHLHNSCFRHF